MAAGCTLFLFCRREGRDGDDPLGPPDLLDFAALEARAFRFGARAKLGRVPGGAGVSGGGLRAGSVVDARDRFGTWLEAEVCAHDDSAADYSAAAVAGAHGPQGAAQGGRAVPGGGGIIPWGVRRAPPVPPVPPGPPLRWGEGSARWGRRESG